MLSATITMSKLFALTDGNRTMTLRVRVFDGGAGFRFEFPEDFNAGELLITDELTEFNIANPSDKTFWNPAYNKDRYEYEYFKTNVRTSKRPTHLTILDSTNWSLRNHPRSVVNRLFEHGTSRHQQAACSTVNSSRATTVCVSAKQVLL